MNSQNNPTIIHRRHTIILELTFQMIPTTQIQSSLSQQQKVPQTDSPLAVFPGK